MAGANRKPIPISRMARALSAGAIGTRTPIASSRAALPHWLRVGGLPCLGAPPRGGGPPERRDRQNIERRKPVSAGSAGVQERLAIESGIDHHGHAPHGAG